MTAPPPGAEGAGPRAPGARRSRPLTRVHATAPGRVCLFGEHCDYLDLPVIAAAIGLPVRVEIETAASGGWQIAKPDLDERDAFTLGPGDVEYPHGDAGDFLRGAVNVLQREGVDLPLHARATVRGEVPINAGTSSSSALQVAWVAALLALGRDARAEDRRAVGTLAHRSEVLEFDGAGGSMDQMSCAVGGLIHLDTQSGVVEPLEAAIGPLVLGNSQEPKETQETLARLQANARAGAGWLAQTMGHFAWHTADLDAIERHTKDREDVPRAVSITLGALFNRDLLHQALAELKKDEIDPRRLGALLSAHHAVLAEVLQISTFKIDGMLEAAMTAGALGGKINGSGGGGCMFALAPERAEEVAGAIRGCEADAWVVDIADGVTVEVLDP